MVRWWKVVGCAEEVERSGWSGLVDRGLCVVYVYVCERIWSGVGLVGLVGLGKIG